MTPRHIPPRLEELGIEKIFEGRGLSLQLFKLLVKSNLTNTAIAKALEEEYFERIGIKQSVRPQTIKRYRELL